MIDASQRASKGETTAMSMSIFNNATPISVHDRMDRREKDEKMSLGRLTGARVDDGLDKAAGLPSLSPPAADSTKKVPEASAAQESSDFSRDFIASQPEAAISAQANQNKRSAMRLLQQQQP
jgi:hypothetical protein